MSSNLQNWLNCCELPLRWLCIYLHLKAYLVTSTRAGWPARSGWERAGERAAARAGSALRGGGTAPPAALGLSPAVPRPSPGPKGPMAAPGPRRPLTCWPGAGAAAAAGLPRSQAPPAGRAPGPAPPRGCGESGGGRLPLACCPGCRGSRRRGQGPGRRGGRGGGSPGPGAGERLRQRGGGAARLGELPACLPARRAEPSLRQTRLDPRETGVPALPGWSLCCRGLASLHGRPAGSGRARERSLLEQPAGEDPNPEVRSSEGVAVLVIRALQKSRTPERQLYWIPYACL